MFKLSRAIAAPMALALGSLLVADRVEAASVIINVTDFGKKSAANIANALAAQFAFHADGTIVGTEDFEGLDGFVAGDGPDDYTHAPVISTGFADFSLLPPNGTGSAVLAPNTDLHVRSDGASTRYNTTTGGANYLDSNDSGGINIAIPSSTPSFPGFSRFSLLATDIDDVGAAMFGITSVGSNVSLTSIVQGSLGTFPNGTLHLITFLFSEVVTDVNITLDIDRNDGFAIDSLVASTVPLPPAAWMLISAIAGLGFLGARKKEV